MEKFLMVALGGALGSVMRYGIVAWSGRALGHGFPWGTMIVNVVGSFVMGLAAVAMMERFPGSWGRFGPLVMTGVLGGFTTFSAYSLDALFLIERGRNAAAAGYIGASVVLSIGGLWVGLTLARGIWGQ